MTITATYRLQLHAGFKFTDAQAVVDYLADLGISHVYASPYLTAEPGSSHGYNLVDPKRLNPEIGTEAEHRAWTDTLAAAGMGHIVDFVPNHMGATQNNPWWQDVLENGPSSVFAEHFDIEWNPPKKALENKILLAVLGGQYGEVLEKGELVVVREGGSFYLKYWERKLPIGPRTMAPVLDRAAKSLERSSSTNIDDPNAHDHARYELESIVVGLRNMPPRTATTQELRAERAREKEILKRRIAMVCEIAEIASAIDVELARLNGKPGDRKSFDELDALLLDQSWRLAFWRVATEEINYRRFFDVNDLAAIRMENDQVFDDTHGLILKLVEEGRLQGIRLDHTDGLFDPAAYFQKLRAATKREVYVVAEKILSQTEDLPTKWQIEGTTGYDFLVQLNGLFVDQRAEESLTRTYTRFTGDARTFAEHAHDAKRAIMRSSLSSEIHMLAQSLERIATRDRRSRDFTLHMLRRAVSETIAAFSVYRTYLRPDGEREPNDEQLIHRAIRMARRFNPEIARSVFEFLRDVLVLVDRHVDEEDRAARSLFAMRFQQLTGPVTAKGVEDTAFYTYVRFTSLNEVGGNPGIFGTSLEAFHRANAGRNDKWPRAMTTTGTHDTKRGEDVRARLSVLSEIPDEWDAWVSEWSTLARKYIRDVDDEPAPSAVDQYLFFQTVLGAYPLEKFDEKVLVDRLCAYANKAAREAKQRTSWLAPDEAYEEALKAFITNMMADEAFSKSLATKVERLATYGASNGLAAALIEIASPGVPDRYQGSELWDLRLVDPDNRSEVDYARRRELAASLGPARDMLDSFRDGRVKLHLVREALRLRRDHPEVFVGGAYAVIAANDDVIAFSRADRVTCLATIRPWSATSGKSPWAVGDVWGDRGVVLSAGRHRDVLTGREITSDGTKEMRLSEIFADLPCALLLRA